MNVTVWPPLLMVMDCWTCGASSYVALPAWLAFTTQVPTLWKLMTPVEMLHAPRVEVASMVKTTALPLGPLLAVGV